MNPIDDGCHAVELRSVSKRFGDRLILDQIDLTIGQGEILVLVGKSGSGKSTLLKVVSGIASPDSGRVLLAGQDCTELPSYRRAVHTVFQSYALFPHLDVFENVAFPLRIAGVARSDVERRVGEALAWVQLSQHAQRRVTSLSGGERQRVALARALVGSPKCVLLDEPLSALDPHLRAETLELLQSLQARLGSTFLFITHDRQEALRLGHRIGVLNQGRLEQIGTPREIYSQPKTAFVASFMGGMNWLQGELLVSADSTAVLIQGHSLPCSPPTAARPGLCTVGIRPEDLHLVGQGGLPATVVQALFLGDSTHVRLSLRDGTTLLLDRRSCDGPLSPGEQVQVTWQAAAARVFSAEELE